MKYCWIVILLLGSAGFSVAEVTAPPAEEVERLALDPFYKKYLSYKGFPIVSSEKVSSFALEEAAYLIDRMLGERDDVIAALVENKVRLVIMATNEFTTDVPEHATLEPKAYWDKRARGLGASKERPAVSVGEENLLGYKGDPYMAESIMVHEFAHALHLMGINSIDPEFQSQLEKVYNRAAIKGLWKGKYAGTNPSEYWAEAVQSWFDTNREDDHDHNHVDTREELKQHDPEIAALVSAVLGDSEWRYQHPKERLEEPHLAGYEPEKSPQFEWPKELVKAYEALDRGDDRELVKLRQMKELPEKAATKGNGNTVNLRFENKRGDRVGIYWIGFDGIRRHYGDIDPGRRTEQSTSGKHLWVVVAEKGSDIGWLSTPEKNGKVEIK